MFKAIASPTQYTHEEKRSEFIAHLYPVTEREQLMEALKLIKIKYPDARHYCWAYLIGNPQQPITAAFNDDGEPSGTAGRPILHVLTQRGAGNTGAIVVRYFGGIKLGAGGLVRAYGQAISKALDNASWNAVVPQKNLTITAHYEDEPHIRHYCGTFNAQVTDQKYNTDVCLHLILPADQLEQFILAINQKTAGRAIIKVNE